MALTSLAVLSRCSSENLRPIPERSTLMVMVSQLATSTRNVHLLSTPSVPDLARSVWLSTAHLKYSSTAKKSMKVMSLPITQPWRETTLSRSNMVDPSTLQAVHSRQLLRVGFQDDFIIFFYLCIDVIDLFFLWNVFLWKNYDLYHVWFFLWVTFLLKKKY